MKSYTTLAFAAAALASLQLHGQGIYFDPSPTDVTAPARLYIDISSPECNCPELLDADPQTNPIYIWAWNPNEQREPVNGEVVTNGEWGSSNENLRLSQDETDPNLWYFDFLGVSLVEFYDVPAATLYTQGIDFLLKEKNGAPGGPEQKSPDLNAIPEPVGCFEKICPFPTTWFQDEYFVITYDNKLEQNTALQNLGEGECLAWYQYRINGGPPITYQVPGEPSEMQFEGDGIFTKTMIPAEFFQLAEGEQLTELVVFITKPPLIAPPFALPVTLVPGCD